MFNNKDRVTYGNSPGVCVNTRYTPPEVHPHSFKNFFFCNQNWCGNAWWIVSQDEVVMPKIGFLLILTVVQDSFADLCNLVSGVLFLPANAAF